MAAIGTLKRYYRQRKVLDQVSWFWPCPKRQILYSSNLKEFADDNSTIDENGSKFSKRLGNTVGKGEIAAYEQVLLFPQCFQNTWTADV